MQLTVERTRRLSAVFRNQRKWLLPLYPRRDILGSRIFWDRHFVVRTRIIIARARSRARSLSLDPRAIIDCYRVKLEELSVQFACRGSQSWFNETQSRLQVRHTSRGLSCRLLKSMASHRAAVVVWLWHGERSSSDPSRNGTRDQPPPPIPVIAGFAFVTIVVFAELPVTVIGVRGPSATA